MLCDRFYALDLADLDRLLLDWCDGAPDKLLDPLDRVDDESLLGTKTPTLEYTDALTHFRARRHQLHAPEYTVPGLFQAPYR